jgi:hypothetical protein
MSPRPASPVLGSLRDDVAAMIEDHEILDDGSTLALAQQIVTVVRERVLQEVQSYARENVR